MLTIFSRRGVPGGLNCDYGELLQTHRQLMKDTIIWNTEAGQNITGAQLARIERKHTELFHRVCEFMEPHEFMICPVNQVPPFDVQQRYITEINGVQDGDVH